MGRKIILLIFFISSLLIHSLSAQDNVAGPREYQKKLRQLRQEAREYFWDLEKLQALLNLEEIYQQQIDSILMARHQVETQLAELDKQSATILLLETKVQQLGENIRQSESIHQGHIQEIKQLNLHLDSVRVQNTQLEHIISQLHEQIDDFTSQKKYRQPNPDSSYANTDLNQDLGVSNGFQVNAIKAINQLTIPEEIERLKQELLRTKITATKQTDILWKYAQALEKKLKQHGIDYQALKRDYLLEMDSVKNEIDFLNLVLLRKDALRKKDSLVAFQRIQMIQAEKKTSETARKFAEFRYSRNKFIFSLIGLVLATLAFAFFYHAQVVGKKKRKIEAQNEVLHNQNQEIQAQKTYIEEANENLKLSYHKITDSIRYAQTIQNAILPNPQDLSRFVEDYFILFAPKDIVSGDFYWIATLENHLYLAVVDCTGHGVPGAFMSMIGNTLLNKIIHEEKYVKPARILERLNEEVRINLNQEQKANNDGMDIALCMLEKKPNHQTLITFSGAKRPLYFIQKSDQSLKEIPGDRKSIGGWRMQKATFENQTLSLESGTMIYLCTDGYADQNNIERIKIGTLRLKELLQENSHLSLQEQHKNLARFLEMHTLNTDQRDDITIIGIKL
ncbi:MAG: SpoIIE family protein phosphatase [Microscillaceae bacterium]|nr:SpoIIE family protein phosphatase [Microscillaceae bacterium]